MKIDTMSDVHLEMGSLSVKNENGAQMLILSGDICVAKYLKREGVERDVFLSFFQQCSEQYQEVVYVMGNHEHYGSDFDRTADTIRAELAQFPNISFLNNEFTTVGGFIVVGSTLWTDMNKNDPDTMNIVRFAMNDFRKVSRGYHRFTPEDAVEEHAVSLAYIERTVESYSDMPVIVVGHHAPSKRSTHPRYAEDYYVNGAYSTDLEEFIHDHPNIVLWTHGHVHDHFDYHVGNTRIVCNPRGYVGREATAIGYKPKTIEVE